MSAFNKKELLTNLHDRTEIIRNNLKPFFQLSEQQLTAQPAPGKWSIAQVFQHLNISLRIYNRTFNRALENAPISNTDQFESGWLGNFFYSKIMPREDGSLFKLKAPKYLTTFKSTSNGEQILHEFNSHLDELEQILEQSRYVDIQKLKVPFSFRWLKIRLGDGLRLMIAHNERHLLQAKRMLHQYQPQDGGVSGGRQNDRGNSDLVNVL